MISPVRISSDGISVKLVSREIVPPPPGAGEVGEMTNGVKFPHLVCM